MARAHPSVKNKDAERCFFFYERIRSRIDGLPVSGDRAVRIPMVCYGLAIDHLLGIAVLLQQGIYASAFALARPSYEGYLRGAWLHACATPADLDAYVADKPGPSFFVMTDALKRTPNFAGATLSQVLEATVPILHSYAHGGFNQAARNWTSNGLEANYSDSDVTTLARFATANALLAFQLMAVEAKRMDLADEALELIKGWTSEPLG